MSHAAVTSYAMPAMAAARAPRPSGAGTPVVEVSRSGAVAGDLACRRCSANLRGLAVTSVCRECGARVGVSLYGELLNVPLIVRLPRQAGQKEVRYAHLLSGEVKVTEPGSEPQAESEREHELDRISRLEQEVEELKKQFQEFRKQFE